MMHVTRIKSGRPNHEYGVGRRCVYPGCGNVLSRYNPDAICASHSLKGISSSLFVVPQNLKVCSTCGELKPSTTEYFRQREERLEAQCRVCTATKRRARDEARMIRDGKRRCAKCNKIKPLTSEYWRKYKISYSLVCLTCLRAQWREASREGRKRKALQLKES